MKGLQHVLMDAATDGAAGGAGAGDGGDGGAGTTGAADTGGAGSGVAASAGEGQGTALQAGAAPATIPEKYQVKKEDGTLDVEASSLKLAEAYGSLEKRLGTGDIPPKTAEEYQITVPDALKDAWKPAEDPLLQGFLKDAHAAGFTQKQVDLAMSKYMEMAPKLVAGSQALSNEECVTQLKAEWKTDEQYKAEVGKAYQAAVGFGGKDADGIIKDHGNDPRIIRLLAKVGAEMGEDKSLNNGGGAPSGGSIDSVMASEAYNDPKHVDHARVSEQVRKHFERQAAAGERAGTNPVM